MKKTILTILTIAMLSSFSTNVFANENKTASRDLTPAELELVLAQSAQLSPKSQKSIDLSKLEAPVKKFFMLFSAEQLKEKAQLLKASKGDGKKGNDHIELRMMLNALKQTPTDGLSTEYQDFLKEAKTLLGGLVEDLEKTSKEKKEDLESLFMVAMKYKPAMEAVRKKYPEITNTFEFFSKLDEKALYKIFDVEEKVERYTKEIREQGESDEKTIKIRVLHSTAKALREMAQKIN